VDLRIPFQGLKEGNHQYQYSIDNKFFEEFPDGDIHQGNLEVSVDLLKRTTGLETWFSIQGKVIVACDRCLDDLEMDINYEGKLFFEFGEETIEVTDELIMIAADENYLDLSPYIYEFIVLSLPIQKFHPNDAKGKTLCNKEMVEKIKELQKKDNSDEKEDPRWDKLKDLLN